MLLQATKIHVIVAVMCIALADCRVLKTPRGEREVSGETGGERSEQTRPAQLLKSVCAQTQSAFINDALPNPFEGSLERYKVFEQTFPLRTLYLKPVTSKSHKLWNQLSVLFSHVLQLLRHQCVPVWTKPAVGHTQRKRSQELCPKSIGRSIIRSSMASTFRPVPPSDEQHIVR